MKTLLQSFVFGTSLVIAAHAFAQAPAAPAKPMTAAPPAVVAAPAPPAKKKAFQTPATAAPGGGADKVWVNSGSKVYHCPGGKYYGKTKAGSYMSEADAKAAGNHAVSKKGCF